MYPCGSTKTLGYKDLLIADELDSFFSSISILDLRCTFNKIGHSNLIVQLKNWLLLLSTGLLLL